MEEKVKVLIAESTFNFSIQISRYLTRRGCNVSIKPDNNQTLYSAIIEKSPDVVILNASLFRGDIVSFINSLKNDCNINVYIIVLMPYLNSRFIKLLKDAGASCIEIPCELHRIYEEIMIRNNFTSDVLVTDKIKYFVRNFGVSSKLKGFEYICTAVYICIFESERFKGLTKNIYPEIALRYNTNSGNIERCIRICIKNFSESAENMDYIRTFLNERGKSKLTNSVFIDIIASEFRKFHLKD